MIMKSFALVFWSCSWGESSQKLFPVPAHTKKMRSDGSHVTFLVFWICNKEKEKHNNFDFKKKKLEKSIYMICHAHF